MKRWLAAVLGSTVMALPVAAESPFDKCHLGSDVAAIEACQAAVKADSRNLELRRALARALSRNARYELAADVYRDITQLAPQDPRGHYEYAAYLAFLRRYFDAVEPLEKSLKLRPDNVSAYRLAAIVYTVVGRSRDMFRVTLAAAKLGDPISMFEAAEYYAEGNGTAASARLALDWMEKAAAAGHVMAMDRMTEIYLDGKLGAPVDDKKAELWATRAYKARRE